MVTAKSGYKKAKPKFSPQSLQSLIRKVHKNPDLLEGDWRDLVRGHFQLSAKEAKGLAETPPRKVKKIQKFLLEVAEHIRGGGTVTGKLVKRSPEEQKKTGLVYDVDVDYAPVKGVQRQNK